MASTEKMLPDGYMPGKEELEKYYRLYQDPEFSLSTQIESFDSCSLPDKYIQTFCSRNPHYTGIGKKIDPEWLDPIDKRCEMMRFSYQMDMQDFHWKEERFRREGSEAAYKALRAAFVTCIGGKICTDYVQMEFENTSEEELSQQKMAHAAKEAEWEAKQERRKKIAAIAKADPYFLEDTDYYDLDEEDIAEAEAMIEESKPRYLEPGWTEAYDARRGYYITPVIAVKVQMARKAVKLTQREFAKKIGYPNVNRYALLEQGRLEDLGLSLYRAFPKEMIKNVAEVTGANPYWLEKKDEDSIYTVRKDETAKTVEEAHWDLYGWYMFTTDQVIRYWWAHHV